MEEERELTRAEMQEEEARDLLDRMRNLDPASDEYKDTQERYKTIMELMNQERELAASEKANEIEEKKSVRSIFVAILGVIASFAFGFRTDKKTEEGELPQKKQTWKVSEGLLKSMKR